MEEAKVYCKDCRHCIVNRTELFGEIVEIKCGKTLEYNDTPFKKEKVQEDYKVMNATNQCAHYIHIADVFGKSWGQRQKDKAEALVKAEERKEHIRQYTFMEDVKLLFNGR